MLRFLSTLGKRRMLIFSNNLTALEFAARPENWILPTIRSWCRGGIFPSPVSLSGKAVSTSFTETLPVTGAALKRNSGREAALPESLLIENCADMEELRSYIVPAWEMESMKRKVANIGEICYSTLRSWQCADRYHFRTIFVESQKDSAVRILEEFYWYWRNYKKLTLSRRNRGD